MQLTTRFNGKVKVLELSGSFDAYYAPQARQWLDEATADKPALIVINLQDVNFLDSTALSTLVHGMKRSRQSRGDMRLCNLQQPVRMVFELTRLDRVFEIYSTEEDAVRAFAVN